LSIKSELSEGRETTATEILTLLKFPQAIPTKTSELSDSGKMIAELNTRRDAKLELRRIASGTSTCKML
jgi:hypothetical protein